MDEYPPITALSLFTFPFSRNRSYPRSLPALLLAPIKRNEQPQHMNMLGVMGEQRKADDVLHEKSGELFIAGGRGDGDGPDESSGSRVALFSSTSSLMVEDDHDEIESSLVVADPTTRSSSLAEHQLDGLSPLLANLSLRSGLSKYYHGKSRSFAHLSPEISLKDVPKKTTTYSTRMKVRREQASAEPRASRSSTLCHIPGPHSNIIRKKAMPRGLLSRTSNRNHLHIEARKSA
ncbi:uncharacterized protein [Lolium perenne]|uniref:uncharacterized protein n=1 Tax=Lolium perenne TaxID=4522 RepID=UPI0021F67CED|nr:protein OXIDATIVE STRESS 3-like [Lolium perenne]